MKKLFLPIFVFALIFSVSKANFAQTNDATDVNADTTKTTTHIAGDVCPVSGEQIAEGDAVEFSYLGTTYKLCCKNCLKKFKSEPMDYIKTELTCPVMGEPASKDEFVVVDNVKYYMCCASCKSKFEKDPEKYLNKEKKDN